MIAEVNQHLIQKYNVPGPRYTSYPTVPFWKNDPLSLDLWKKTIDKNRKSFTSDALSVYIHLPYCENLCTFCGCHKRITKNHAVEEPYIDGVIKEWNLYRSLFPFAPAIQELHLGGGTPTFFSATELIRMLRGIFNADEVDSKRIDLGFEAHPMSTSEEHLTELYHFGFRRLSLGVQDYSEEVQKAIHRIQPFEDVEKVHNLARKIGYTASSHDLVFGLPKQRKGMGNAVTMNPIYQVEVKNANCMNWRRECFSTLDI
jgi:oxygen-independent coproporphyrinogen-3 oxidase